MPIAYGVGTTKNKFVLFEDVASDEEQQEDPYDLLKKQEDARAEAKAKALKEKMLNKSVPPKAKKSNKITYKPVTISIEPSPNAATTAKSKPVQKSSTPVDTGISEASQDRSRNPPNGPRQRAQKFGSRNEEFGTMSEAPPRFERQQRDQKPRFGPKRYQHEKNDRLERHSGSLKTGVKHVDKREGGGSRNWGTPADDIKDVDLSKPIDNEEGVPAGDVTAQPDDKENSPKTGEGTDDSQNVDDDVIPDGTVVPDDAAEKQMTLDEWKKLQEESRMTLKTTNMPLRKPGEGVDQSQWKKTYVLKRESFEDDKDDDDDTIETSDEIEERRVLKPERVLGLEFKFEEPAVRGKGRRGGGVGGRGGRGGGGPGGNRDSRGGGMRNHAPAMQSQPPGLDEQNFPKLS